MGVALSHFERAIAQFYRYLARTLASERISSVKAAEQRDKMRLGPSVGTG